MTYSVSKSNYLPEHQVEAYDFYTHKAIILILQLTQNLDVDS